MTEIILFTNVKTIRMLKSFWSFNMRKDCERKYFHRKDFYYHLLAFGKVVGHSTPCGTLYHKSRKRACCPEWGWEKGKRGKKKNHLNTALLKVVHQGCVFAHVLSIELQ